MDTTLEGARQKVKTQLTKLRWAIGINGALAVQGPFFPYTTGQRFRVRVRDNHDGKTTISYERLVSGTFTEFAMTTQVFPSYPLRVSASFREQFAVIENPTIMRIKP